MSARQLVVRPGLPSQQQRVHLDGVEYILTLRWSQRESRWYMDIAAATGARLVTGLALSLFTPILEPVRTLPGLPPGEFMLFDTRIDRADPTLASFGDSVLLVYGEGAGQGTSAAQSTKSHPTPGFGFVGP